MTIGIKCKLFKSSSNLTKNKSFDNAETEKCVLCGKDTDIPLNRNISWRKYYIRGCGQLCEKCYYDLKYSRASENTSSDKNM